LGPARRPPMIALARLLSVHLLLALGPLPRDATAAWALPFYLATLVPQAGAEGSERALYLPLLPGAVLLAILLVRGRSAASRLTRFGGRWAFYAVLLPGLVLSLASSLLVATTLGIPGRQLASLADLVEARRPAQVLVLNTSGPLLTFYLRDEVAWRLGRPVDVRVLSSLNGVMTVERTGPGAFVLRTDRRGWLTNMFAMIPRRDTALSAGQRFETELFTATVLELAPGEPPHDALAVRFDLRRPDDPGLLLAAWTGHAYQPVDLASLPIGERRPLADTSDLWEGMTE